MLQHLSVDKLPVHFQCMTRSGQRCGHGFTRSGGTHFPPFDQDTSLRRYISRQDIGTAARSFYARQFLSSARDTYRDFLHAEALVKAVKCTPP